MTTPIIPLPELLPARALQARTMTITAGPGVSPFEAGHWYSPAAVEEYAAARVAELEAEVSRLREALRRILDWDAAGMPLTDYQIAKARAALKEQEQRGG